MLEDDLEEVQQELDDERLVAEREAGELGQVRT